MKKILFLLALLCFRMFGVEAASGDIAGEYFSTSIGTFLNGYEIDSINIGGQTLISAEAMHFYSFNVFWDGSERTLRIYSVPHAANGAVPHIKKSNYPDGAVLGHYYETDIVTYLDDKPVTAYNIGGKTYIHAEGMRNLGYEVIWNEEDRNLFITSPDRAGYVFDIKLSTGKEQSSEAEGGFSLKYTPQSITASGDAEYCNIDFYSRATAYEVVLGFYQNGGLFRSGALIDVLNSLATNQLSTTVTHTEEEIAEIRNKISQYINLSVNGKRAENITVSSFKGNGHISFLITVDDILGVKLENIEEIVFSVGKVTDAEEFEITNQQTDVEKFPAFVAENLKKHENDHMVAYYQAEEYFVVFMKESSRLGQIDAHRLYLVNRLTWECSEDILEQVRQFEGFNDAIIHPFDYNSDGDGKFMFACKSKEKTGNFYVELDSAKVNKISEITN